MHKHIYLVVVVAVAVNLAIGLLLGMNRPLESDSLQFRQIAVSLAAGNGYSTDATFWPGPTMQRMPGWPAVCAVVLRLLPVASPDAAIRGLSLLLNVFAAIAVWCFAWFLFRQISVASAAGLLYALHPVALFLAYNAASEVLFLVLALSGCCLVLARPAWRWCGFLLLGLAALERANFILWILLFLAATWIRNRRADEKIFPTWPMATMWLLLFCAPLMLWTVRNQRISGHWPVVSTLRGQTFYGGNNELTASSFKYWGYWVFPDQIPGEEKLADLAKAGVSEYEADARYFTRGIEFLQHHPGAIPRLLVGKIVRAYIPIPWAWSWSAAIVAAYRWFTLIAMIAGIRMSWRRLDPAPRALLIAMSVTNLATVLVFWGYSRFAFALEPFWLPLAGFTCTRYLELLRGKMRHLQPLG